MKKHIEQQINSGMEKIFSNLWRLFFGKIVITDNANMTNFLNKNNLEKGHAEYHLYSEDKNGKTEAILKSNIKQRITIYKNSLMYMCDYKDKEDKNSIHEFQIYYLKFQEKKFIKDFLEDMTEIMNSRVFINFISKVDQNGKITDTIISARNIESIYIDEEIKNRIIKNIEEFLKPETKLWYEKNNISYKLNILLSGPPGTGKSSLVKSLANKFERHIFIPEIRENNASLILENMNNNNLLLLEEIDVTCVDIVENRANKNIEKNKLAINLQDLLTILDGLETKSETIAIATTNHLDRLDPALTRRGRFDYIYEIPLPKYSEFNQMYNKFFENEYLDVKEKFINYCINKNLTIADAQGICIEYRNDFYEFIETI